MSPVALRFYDSAIPTPRRSDVARARRYLLGVMIVPRRLASAPRFFVLLLVVHIIPPNSSESYVIFYGASGGGHARRRFIGGGPRLFRLSLRVSPVAQHVPAGTVRKARDSMEEVEVG